MILVNWGNKAKGNRVMTELTVLLIGALITSFVTQRNALIHLLSGEIVTNFIKLLGAIFNSLLITGIRVSRCIQQKIHDLLSRSKGYQIKHIFLIDRESGIQVEEVSSKGECILNGDAISAMFSAIQSFVHDAFSRDQSSRLTDFRVGDHSIWVAHGPKLMLACVMVGEVPKELKDELDHALQVIQSEFVASLSDVEQPESVEGVAKVMQEFMLAQKSISMVGSL